jgi:hypothetical protein
MVKKIVFSNKLFYTLVAILVIILLAVGINALIPGTAPNPGHSMETVAPPFGCASGEYLRWNSPNWECVGDSEVQRRVSGTCIGKVMTGINSDGTVACETDDTGTSLTLNPNVYQAWGSQTTSMGSHFFCFLVTIVNGGPYEEHAECEVAESGGVWSVRALTGGETLCKARCVDNS